MRLRRLLGVALGTALAIAPLAACDTASVPASTTSNPLVGTNLYVSPTSDAAKTRDAWLSTRPDDAAQIDKIARYSQAIWLDGSFTGDKVDSMVSYALTSQNATQIFSIYNIVHRDCGMYSAGGASDPDTYKAWVDDVARGIGQRKVVLVLEPDALWLMRCLSSADQATRLNLLSYAVDAFKANPNAVVYIDAGANNGGNAVQMASYLTSAGVDRADGFALNVAHFQWTNDAVAYGHQISQLIGGKHFIVDTGRNGRGPYPGGSTYTYNGVTYPSWCNPPGTGLGQPPTTDTGDPTVDAFLWVKHPGNSDGPCNGGTGVGWWADWALQVATLSSW